MCGSMADIQSPTAEIRRGIKKEERNSMKIYMVSLLHRATINKYRSSPGFSKLLGPLLFLLYVNDISNAVPGAKIFLQMILIYFFMAQTSQNYTVKQIQVWNNSINGLGLLPISLALVLVKLKGFEFEDQ